MRTRSLSVAIIPTLGFLFASIAACGGTELDASSADAGADAARDGSSSGAVSDGGAKDGAQGDSSSTDAGLADASTDATTTADASDDAASPIDAGPATYTVGGTTTGLLGTGLVLQNNGTDDLPVNTEGSFTFAKALSTGDAYGVTILTQPTNPNQTCTIDLGLGVIGTSPITDVHIICATDPFPVGGTVTGLPAGATVDLTNNGADDLTLGGDGPFVFGTKLAPGATYEVKVKAQTPGVYCAVNAGSGTVANAAVSDVSVTCTLATSCKAIKDADGSAPDGKYTLINATGDATYDAYCDMTTDGGGFTLALKAGGASTVFHYDATYWTDDVTLAEASTDLSPTEAKFASFSNVPFGEVRAVFDTGGIVQAIKFAQAGASLKALFGGGFIPTNAGRAGWMGLVPGSGLQAFCNQEGFNNDIGPYAKARLGILGNQEDSCDSPDSLLGFGTAGGLCNAADAATVGNKAACDPIYDINDAPVAGPIVIQSFGYLFVR